MTIYVNRLLNERGFSVNIGKNNNFSCETPEQVGALVKDILTDEDTFWKKYHPEWFDKAARTGGEPVDPNYRQTLGLETDEPDKNKLN